MSFYDPFDFVLLDSYDSEGKVIKTQSFPFVMSEGDTPWEEGPVQVVEKDKLGRPVLAQGINGETVYYDYVYDREQRLTVKDGRALRFVKQYHYPQHGSRNIADAKDMVFVQQGYLSVAKTKISTHHICTSEYVELDGKAAVRTLKRVYDSHGKLIRDFYWDAQEEEFAEKGPLKSVSNSGRMVSKSRKKDLARSIEQIVKSDRRQKLEDQVDAWTQKTWKDF